VQSRALKRCERTTACTGSLTFPVMPTFGRAACARTPETKSMEPTIDCPHCAKVYPRRQLHCPSCGQIGVPKLYKYLPYNAHSLSLLINKQIWCPKAKTLNDPFEFNFHLTATNLWGIPINQASLEKTKNDLKELGVVCFSEINNDILMWSHYADGHSGFCIEFERSDNNDLGKWDYCLPVTYDAVEAPSFDPPCLEERASVAKIVSSKAPNWSYEKEWRLIISREFADGLISLPARITAVIFGCKMDDTRRRTIANIQGRDVSYLEAVQLKDSCGLSIKQILFEAVIE